MVLSEISLIFLGSGYEVFMKFEPPALNVDQDEHMEERVKFFEEHFSQLKKELKN